MGSKRSILTLDATKISTPGGTFMLYWALVFFVVALVAGLLGFTGIAIAAAGVSKILFVVFLVLFLVSLLTHVIGGRRSSLG
jgi:uncharacterized membrane protein YtjA (UPF0391 family)